MTAPAILTADPVAIAQSVIDHALEVMAQPPARVHVGWGEPAAPQPTDGCDNEQLTVHLGRMRPKLLNDSQAVNTRVPALSWIVELALIVWRCVPLADGEQTVEPDAAALDEAYKALTAEATTVARHLSRLFFRDEWDELEACRDVAFGNLDPITPSGGIAGWRLGITVQL